MSALESAPFEWFELIGSRSVRERIDMPSVKTVEKSLLTSIRIEELPLVRSMCLSAAPHDNYITIANMSHISQADE